MTDAKIEELRESFHYMLIELIAAVRVDDRDSNKFSKQEVKDLLQSVMDAYANRIPEREVSVCSSAENIEALSTAEWFRREDAE